MFLAIRSELEHSKIIDATLNFLLWLYFLMLKYLTFILVKKR